MTKEVITKDTPYVRRLVLVDAKDLEQYSPGISERYLKGMGCSGGFFPGWKAIIVNLDKKLLALYPEYVIDQIKIKFGGLRYYVTGVEDEGHILISQAEYAASKVCCWCGKEKEGCTCK